MNESQNERDLHFEESLGRVLGSGVVASSLFLAVGLVLSLMGAASSIAKLLLTGGLLLLMATPPARVIVSAATYLLRRDWLFAALTLIVFLELLASVLAAFRITA
jgi:uncharacterized membrane protein